MPKQSFQEASNRSESRRAHGAETHNPLNNKTQTSLGYGGWVSELTTYCDENAPSSTQGTTAVGRLAAGYLFIASNVGAENFDLDAAAKRFSVPKTRITFCKKASGLHQEMAIVRTIVEANLALPDTLFLAGLEIGTTKGCCLDCAGWLNEHNIPHTATNGSGSDMWRHPVTNSVYQGGTSLEYYHSSKHGKSFFK